jgi:hypothetical protein
MVNLDVDPLGVGDIRLVRTFRVGPDGELFPVNSATAWRDGWNNANCLRGFTHTPPDPDCRCGFYLYSAPAYVLAQAPARQVLAACAVNGALEAGTRGARVQRARVEALWLGRRVNPALADTVQRRYPSVQIYRDRGSFDGNYPLTKVDGFAAPRVGERARGWWRAITWCFLAAVAVLGCFPIHVVLASRVGAGIWLAAIAGGFALGLTATAQRSPVTALQGIAAVAWLVTVGPNSIAQLLARALFVIPLVCVVIVWRRAGTPGRAVRPPRFESWMRRGRPPLASTD